MTAFSVSLSYCKLETFFLEANIRERRRGGVGAFAILSAKVDPYPYCWHSNPGRGEGGTPCRGLHGEAPPGGVPFLSSQYTKGWEKLLS